jgi:uncharacterized membrane protein
MNTLIPLIPVLVTGVLFALLPHYYRPNYAFGITVSPEFRNTDQARSARRSFQRDVFLWTILAVGLLLAWPHELLVRTTAAPLVQLVGVFWSWFRQRRRIRPYAVAPETVREAELTAVSESMYGRWLIWLLPFTLIALAVIYTQQYAHLLPDRIPIHYGLKGPDAWAPRSWRTVYLPLIVGALTMCILVTIGIAMSYGARRGRTPEQDTFRRANLRLLLGMHWATAFMFAVFGTAPVRDVVGPSIPFWAPVGVLLGVLIVFGWQTFKANQVSPGPDPTPDECWHAGDFYYNPADPAFIVEKRFGIGYTFNLAHKLTWLVLGQIVLIVASAILLTRG